MSTPRERFRQAAADLAESFYDLLRADLMAQAVATVAPSPGAATPSPAPDPAPPASARAAPGGASRVDLLAAWLKDHGPASPNELRVGLGWRNSSLFEVLKKALAQGAIAKRVEGRLVQYFVAGADASTTTSSAEPSPEVRRSVLDHLLHQGASTVADLLGGVGGDAATIRAVLSEAREAGRVQTTGRGHSARFALVMPDLGDDADAPAVHVDEKPAAARPKPDQSPIDGLVSDVAAFVAAHPECRYGEIRTAVTASDGRLDAALKEARSRGLIRLEGVKIKSRYFPATSVAPRTNRERDLAAAAAPVEAPGATPSRPPPAGPARVAAGHDARDHAPPEVLAVLNELELALAEDMHDIRLGAVLQAIVADVRGLQARFPEGHPARRRLDGTIRRITAIRAERDLGFINGLKRDAQANWHLVAREARKRIAAFDADAEVGAPKARPSKPAKAKAPTASRDEIEQPLPNLIALNAERPVILVGGIKKNEVIEQVRAHHGLDVEWAAMQGTNARAAEHLYERIKHGRVGAVVILEGLTGTSQVKTVVEACKSASLPFAYGGRAGTESLRSALTELEMRATGTA